MEESKSEDTDDSMSELKRNIPPTSMVRSVPNDKPFSQRVRDGEIKVDLKSTHNVAN